jgi:serine/threonine protein kinase
MSYIVSPFMTFSDDCPSQTTSSQPISTALGLVTAIAEAGVTLYTEAALGLLKLEARTAGSGGFSTIQIGTTINKQLVAVKHNSRLSRPFAANEEKAFQHHLSQLCIELRILSHKTLKVHENVVNLLGILAVENSGQPTLSLVLEYSPIGDLSSFLRSQGSAQSVDDHLDFAFQIAQGLVALHSLSICHGDVKTLNVLVFHEKDHWRLKLSDFGQAIIASRDDKSTLSSRPFGTPLLSAPELRTAVTLDQHPLTIEMVIRTDVFSFGLLTWEVLKNGQSFFSDICMEAIQEDLELSEKLTYLNNLPPNELCHHSLSFLRDINLTGTIARRISSVFEGSLQDDPHQRRDMSSLANDLDQKNTLSR